MTIITLLPLMQFTKRQNGRVLVELEWETVLQKVSLKMLSLGSEVIKILKSYRMGPAYIPVDHSVLA